VTTNNVTKAKWEQRKAGKSSKLPLQSKTTKPDGQSVNVKVKSEATKEK
jgi:hypothetical protein